ncbi:hypothetical protein JW978_01765 [Candidatus Dojkabacteria bacterium]|nr:hypothetical protein [Candidatus Dojkabacteria bacterium]
MYPVLFTIQSVEIKALPVFVALGLIIFGINLWKSTKDIKNFAFDLFFLNIVLNPIIARIAHVLLNLEQYSGNGFSLLPIKDVEGGVELFTTFPWLFFSFWQKGMNFQFLPLVAVISLLVLVKFRKERLVDLPIAEIWKSFFMGFIVILFGFFLDGTYLSASSDFPLLLRYKGQSEDLLPVHLLEMILVLVGLIFYVEPFNLFKEKMRDRFRTFFLPIYWAGVQIGLWFILADYSKDLYIFDIAQIIWFGMIILFIFSFLPPLGISASKKGRIPENQKKRVVLSDIASIGHDYSYSFSNYKKDLRTRMTPREKLKQVRNRIKRGA